MTGKIKKDIALQVMISLKEIYNAKQNEISNPLSNLFFVLRTFGIEAYQEELVHEQIKFNKEDLGKRYRIISGELEYNQGEAIIKYPGWKVKDKLVVLPGITII